MFLVQLGNLIPSSHLIPSFIARENSDIEFISTVISRGIHVHIPEKLTRNIKVIASNVMM